jgi:hypothetical protein
MRATWAVTNGLIPMFAATGTTILRCTLSLSNFDVASFSYLQILCDSLLPALVLHFAGIFPLRLLFVDQRPWIIKVPYAVSAVLLVLLLAVYMTPAFSKFYFFCIYPYTCFAILFFGISVVFVFQRSFFLGKATCPCHFLGRKAGKESIVLHRTAFYSESVSNL